MILKIISIIEIINENLFILFSISIGSILFLIILSSLISEVINYISYSANTVKKIGEKILLAGVTGVAAGGSNAIISKSLGNKSSSDNTQGSNSPDPNTNGNSDNNNNKTEGK